ncbi:MAG TPA: TetR/AcrR family transcriptional regulator [Chloroflexota bacterium]|nr:TetR/AcrR family transcriptional regulator [Chloroflexota bacterium]
MTQQVDHPEGTIPVLEPGPSDRRQERRDAAENRKRVLDVARRLFEEFGVEAVSMHQIARAAGVGQGTLYRRYPHKGELCRDLLGETTDTFRAEVDTYLTRSATDTPALERLNYLLERYIALMDTKTSLLAAIGDACWGQRRIEKFASSGYRWAHSTITGLLSEAVDKGELRPVDPSFTADALLAALSPDVYQFQRDVRGLNPEEILQGVRGIVS